MPSVYSLLSDVVRLATESANGGHKFVRWDDTPS